MLSRHAQRVYGASQRRQRKAARTSVNPACGSDICDDFVHSEQGGKVARNREFEEALRRRDFRVVLWMIANGDVPAHYETVGGDTALLAAISAKDTEAVKRIVAGYVPGVLVACFALDDIYEGLIVERYTRQRRVHQPAQQARLYPADESDRGVHVVTSVTASGHQPQATASKAFQQ
jgi:hypothetical protein